MNSDSVEPLTIDDVFVVREIDDASALAGELFQRRYRERIPDFPHHVIGFWKTPDGVERAACYIHFTPLGDILLGGGACTDDRLMRRMPVEHRALLREAGGVYAFTLSRSLQIFRSRFPAIFGYCGDRLAERIDRAVGFQPTPHPHLLVYFTRALDSSRQAQLIAQANAVGPF